MDANTVLLFLSLLFGFYMAWSIGANDVANAMGTSVGSGALTLRRAVILAAILEFAGAFLVGSHVTETIRSGIIDPQLFAEDPMRLVCGMLAALLAAGAWLQLASYFGWPVSTTHSIVGAIVGVGAVAYGLDAVDWGWSGMSGIIMSWVISPLLAAAISYMIFQLLLRFIFYAPLPAVAARRATPVLVFLVFFVMSLVTVYKGLGNLGLDQLPGAYAVAIAAGVGLAAAGLSTLLVNRLRQPTPAELGPEYARDNLRSLERAMRHLRRVQLAGDAQTAAEAGRILQEMRSLSQRTEVALAQAQNPVSGSNAYRDVERVFVLLQIVSACFVAFAHGANDVANAIGPLSAVIHTLQTGAVYAKAEVPAGILALGGVGIVVGLATWGWRVIQTIGKRITELTPSRGFAAEFGAATTIVVASKLGLPISTTHTLVGAVLGVGLARGIGALNLNTLRDIIASWLITIPAGAGLAIIFYYILVMIFL